jgi:hypothetical protein
VRKAPEGGAISKAKHAAERGSLKYYRNVTQKELANKQRMNRGIITEKTLLIGAKSLNFD